MLGPRRLWKPEAQSRSGGVAPLSEPRLSLWELGLLKGAEHRAGDCDAYCQPASHGQSACLRCPGPLV